MSSAADLGRGESVGNILTLLSEFPGKGSATVGRMVVLPLCQGSGDLLCKGQVTFGQRSGAAISDQRRACFRGQKRGLRLARCDTRKLQGVIFDYFRRI